MRTPLSCLLSVVFACPVVLMGGCEKPEVAIAAGRDRSVKTTDIRRGNGNEVRQGSTVTCHYKGFLPDGKEFMDTRKKGRGKPHTWRVGDGSVIAGMDIAVVGMKSGGVREAVMPPEMHWGNNGYGGVIPKGAYLKFRIELVNVR